MGIWRSTVFCFSLGISAIGIFTTTAIGCVTLPKASVPNSQTLQEQFSLEEQQEDLPIRLQILHTADQWLPADVVLEGQPHAPFRMTYPATLVTWADGRSILIEGGMEHLAAQQFGRTLRVFSAEPMSLNTTPAQTYKWDLRKLRGVVFTHLHHDHTDAAAPLCDLLKRYDTNNQIKNTENAAVSTINPIQRFHWQTPNQAKDHDSTYTQNLLPCFQQKTLDAAPSTTPVTAANDLAKTNFYRLPDFPGIFLVETAGHSLGSQIIFVTLKKDASQLAAQGSDDAQNPQAKNITRYAFIGDLVNHRTALCDNRPKSFVYRALLQEDDDQLSAWRQQISLWHQEIDVYPIVAHDYYNVQQVIDGDRTLCRPAPIHPNAYVSGTSASR